MTGDPDRCLKLLSYQLKFSKAYQSALHLLSIDIATSPKQNNYVQNEDITRRSSSTIVILHQGLLYSNTTSASKMSSSELTTQTKIDERFSEMVGLQEEWVVVMGRIRKARAKIDRSTGEDHHQDEIREASKKQLKEHEAALRAVDEKIAAVTKILYDLGYDVEPQEE